MKPPTAKQLEKQVNDWNSKHQLAAFFALLDRRTKEHEKQQAEERKAKEDKKLARLKPWWTLASQ